MRDAVSTACACRYSRDTNRLALTLHYAVSLKLQQLMKIYARTQCEAKATQKNLEHGWKMAVLIKPICL